MTFQKIGDIMSNPKFLAELERIRLKQAGELPQDDAVCATCKGAQVLKNDDFDPLLNNFAPVLCPDCGEKPFVERIIHASGLETHRDDTFEQTPARDEEQQPFWEAGADYAGNPQGWLWMVGEVGQGKSHLARCIGNEWLLAGKPVVFRVVEELMDELKDAMDRGKVEESPAFATLWGRLMGCPLLILDEYGAQHETPWVTTRIDTLLNHRWLERIPTIVTTNWSRDQMQTNKPRLHSRASDSRLCRLLDFDVSL